MFVFSSSSSECSSKCSPFCRISCRKEKTLDKLYCASYPNKQDENESSVLHPPSLSLHPATPILHPNAPNAKRKGYCKTIAGNCISFWVISQIRTETLIQGFSPFLYVPAKPNAKRLLHPEICRFSACRSLKNFRSNFSHKNRIEKMHPLSSVGA